MATILNVDSETDSLRRQLAASEVAAAAREDELARERDEALKRLRWFEAAHTLLANDAAFIFRNTDHAFFMSGAVGEMAQPALALNMNDEFWWGCADCEPFDYIDAPALLEIAKRDGADGLLLWVREKRKAQPNGFDFDEKHVKRYHPNLPVLERALGAEAKLLDAEAHAARLQAALEGIRERGCMQYKNEPEVFCKHDGSAHSIYCPSLIAADALSSPAPSGVRAAVMEYVKAQPHGRDCMEADALSCRCGKDAALRALGETP